MNKFKPCLCLILIIVILIPLTSCTPAVVLPTVTTPSVTASAAVTLPANVRVKGAAWVAEDILAYYAEDGVHIWNAESGEGPVLAVSDTFNTDERANFALSPDQSKLCVSIISNRGKRSYDVFDLKSAKLFKHLELTDDFKEITGSWGYGYDSGFFDDNTLYTYNIFGMWFVDINTGEQRRISADALDFYKSCDGDEQDYFEWVYAPVLVEGKLYYSGIRNKNHQSRIYCADLNGEIELDIPGNVQMTDAASGHGFLYVSTEQPDDRKVWYYNINNAISDLVSDQRSLYLLIRGNKIAYNANRLENNELLINLYDINTKQTQSFKIYSTERDFPSQNYSQMGQISGFVPDGDGYAFLFTIFHASDKYLVYSTETDKAVVTADYSDYWLTESTINPSGDYTLIANYNLRNNSYPFRVVKTIEYIHPDSTN